MNSFLKLRWLLVLTILVLPRWALAAPFDGTKPLVCGVFQSVACDETGDCEAGKAGEFNLPQLLRVDFAGKKLGTARQGGGERVSSIRHQDSVGSSLILQGGEEERGWSMVIDQETGQMTGSVIGDGLGFLVFGSCAAF